MPSLQQTKPGSFCSDYPRRYLEEGEYHGEIAHLAKAGFIEFPRDIERRRMYFMPKSMEHPAKANIYLIERLVDYLTEPGELILDPMSGTGTLMMATLTGRKVACVEDAAIFHWMQQESKALFVARGVKDEDIMLLHGPCQDYLPFPCDHIIFSPPYSSVLNFEVKNEAQVAMGGSTYVKGGLGGSDVFSDYRGTDKNFGRLNAFMYNQKISVEYGKMIAGLRPGGTLTVIVQDLIQGGKRVGLSNWVMRTCVRQGVELLEWHCRYSPGTGFKSAMKAKGLLVVQNEDIIIMRKPL